MPPQIRPSSLRALEQFRRILHAQPRVSNDEGDTVRLLTRFVAHESSNVEVGCPLMPLRKDVGGGHGLVYEVRGEKADDGSTAGTGTLAPSVLLRADTDALPLVEESGMAHASQVLGCHHACGHDGHTAILAGALLHLYEHRATFSGRVVAVFQPAEETGDGARQMLAAADDLLGSAAITRGAYGLHNIPGSPLGQVLLRREGVATRASLGLRAHVTGVASHASQPDQGVSPALGLGRLLSSRIFDTLPDELVERGRMAPQIGERALATPVHLRVGSDGDYGVFPADGLLCLTLRTDTTGDLETLRTEVEAQVRSEMEVAWPWGASEACEAGRAGGRGSRVDEASDMGEDGAAPRTGDGAGGARESTEDAGDDAASHTIDASDASGGFACRFEAVEQFPATVNDSRCVGIVLEAVEAAAEAAAIAVTEEEPQHQQHHQHQQHQQHREHAAALVVGAGVEEASPLLPPPPSPPSSSISTSSSPHPSHVQIMDRPFPWSEDFGHFSTHESGAVLFGLGSGLDHPPLHSKTYDFNDELIAPGVDLWVRIALSALASKEWVK